MRLNILMILLLFCGFAIAQKGEMKEERKEMRKERFERMQAIKIAYITKELNLTSEESQKFWPVYNKHHESLKAIRESSKKLSKTDITEADADAWISKTISGEYEKARVHEEMANELKPIIGSVRVVKLAKAEHKFKREILSKANSKRKHRMKENDNK